MRANQHKMQQNYHGFTNRMLVSFVSQCIVGPVVKERIIWATIWSKSTCCTFTKGRWFRSMIYAIMRMNTPHQPHFALLLTGVRPIKARVMVSILPQHAGIIQNFQENAKLSHDVSHKNSHSYFWLGLREVKTAIVRDTKPYDRKSDTRSKEKHRNAMWFHHSWSSVNALHKKAT